MVALERLHRNLHRGPILELQGSLDACCRDEISRTSCATISDRIVQCNPGFQAWSSSLSLSSLSLSQSPPNPKPTSLDRRGEEEAFFAPPARSYPLPGLQLPARASDRVGSPAYPSPPLAPGPGPIGPQFFKFQDLHFPNLGIRVIGGEISHFW